MSLCVARDAAGRWCLRALAGGGWVAIECADPHEAVRIATFVFEGRSRELEILDVTEWHPSTRAKLDEARTLDELIEAPPWIRAAVAQQIRERRASR